jgi:hypothetical protein
MEKPPNILVELPPPPPPPPPIIQVKSALNNDTKIDFNLMSYNNRVKYLFNQFKQSYYDSLINSQTCKYLKLDSLNYLNLIYDDKINYYTINSDFIKNNEKNLTTTSSRNYIIINTINNNNTSKSTINGSISTTTILTKKTHFLTNFNTSFLQQNITNIFVDKSNNYTILLDYYNSTVPTNISSTNNETNKLASVDIHQSTRSYNFESSSSSSSSTINTLLSVFNLSGLFLPLLFVVLVLFLTFFLVILTKK